MRLQHTVIALVMLMAAAVPASAQRNKGAKKEDNRQQWEQEMTQYKHDLLSKELDLKDEQKTQFFALYDAMDRERRAQYGRIGDIRREIDRKANPSDEEYLKAAGMEYTVAAKVNEVELKYFKEYRKVLSAKQLYKLKKAEHKFMRNLRKHASTAKKASK